MLGSQTVTLKGASLECELSLILAITCDPPSTTKEQVKTKYNVYVLTLWAKLHVVA